MSFDDARRDMLRVGDELGAAARARALVAGFDRELAAARTTADKGPDRGTALYVTPGDVTTGPGSLVAEVMGAAGYRPYRRSEEHKSEIQSLMSISYAVFCLKKKKHKQKPQ